MAQDPKDTVQAAQQAEQLRQVSKTLDGGISQLQELYSQVRGQWYGPASEAYCKALDQLILQMQDTNSKLTETAAALESAQSNAGQS